MPQVHREARINSSLPLEDFVNLALHAWLFTAGYEISSECQSAEKLEKGVVVNSNFGGLIFKFTNVDRTGGIVEYEMLSDRHELDKIENTMEGVFGPAGLRYYKCKLNITEAEEEGVYILDWTVDFAVKVWLLVTSFGFFLLEFKSLQHDVLKNNISRIGKAVESQS